MDGIFTDLKYGLRTFLRSPGFTIAALATLALGIGATTAVFSVVNTVLLKPLPYLEPDRIVIFASSSPTGPRMYDASPVNFKVWSNQTGAFENISAYRYGKANMIADNHIEQIQAAVVSVGYFRLFGQRIVRGRAFTADEDQPNSNGVVVISDSFWKSVFARDPQIIGKTISIGDKLYEVIGIMSPGSETDPPASFDTSSVRDPIDVWMPFQIDHDSIDQNGYFNVAARLKTGVSLQAAAAQMQLVTQEFRRRYPADENLPPNSVFTVQVMREALVSGERSSLSIFSGAVLFVLLIACANVANLVLVRATGRNREIAIRAALGAGRGRIVRQLLTEGVGLSIVGGALGAVLGIVGIRALLSLNAVNIPRIGNQGIAVTADWRILSFALFASLTTGILCYLIPAVQLSDADLSKALKEGSGCLGTGFRQSKGRSVLVVSEVTLALVLSIGAGLLIRSFVAVLSVNPGFDSRHVLTMQASLTAPRFQKTAGVAELVRDSIQRISALAGVASVASTCCLPLEKMTQGGVIIVGRPLSGRSHGVVDVTTVSPQYFDVLKIPVLRGRAFTERDGSGGPPVVLISDSMARRYWPKDRANREPLNTSLVFTDLPALVWQIVGIVGDVHADGLNRYSPPIVYFSIPQIPDGFTTYLVRNPVTWIVRSRDQSQSFSSSIQKELTQAGAGLPVSNVRSMDEILVRSAAAHKFNMLLLSTFSGLALLLAAVGVYGFMAYSVQQRRQEIGIRLALGAASSDLRTMIVFQGMRLALAGVCIGLVGSFVLTRFIASFLFGVRVQDPIVFIVVPVLLCAVALAAIWFPARHASRIDAIEALRYE